MFTRILTALEREVAGKYLKKGGAKIGHIQVLASRANKHLPAIRNDMRLLEQLLSQYNGTKKR